MRETEGAPAAVHLDASRIAVFLEWSRAQKRNSRKWVAAQSRYLDAWRAVLAGVDLRGLNPQIVKGHLRFATARQQRIAVLKRFVSWLAEEGELASDPLVSLRVPQSRPAQWRRPKVVDAAALDACRALLTRTWRDALDVLLGTGWHLTELERFARGGTMRDPLPNERSRLSGRRVAGVLCTIHKHGAPHLTAVSRRTLRAARRVRGREGICVSHLAAAIREAARAAKVAPWAPGQIRHTVASYALARGAPVPSVADFLGHKDPRTTRRFYAVWVAPSKVPTPI